MVQPCAARPNGLLPFPPLVGGEVEAQGHELERCEEATGEVGHRQFEHGRADDIDELLGRRAPGWRRAQLECLVAAAVAEVVNLIHDDELESIADLVHMPPGALERGDGDGLEPALAVAETADRTRVDGRDLPGPLLEEHARRNQGQRRASGARHGDRGDAGLAGAGGQDDDAASSGALPRPQRFVLVRAQGRFRPPARQVRGAGDLVRDMDTPPRQLCSDDRVEHGGRAQRANSRVPQNAR